MWSSTLRWGLAAYYGVTVGRLSYGPSLLPGGLPPGTTIGAFCSLAAGLAVFRRNHPTDRISQHPLFFNSKSGGVPSDTVINVRDNPLHIDHDVWIGHGVVVTPGCRSIGISSVVASGAVVTRDVPPFTIVGGNPAKPLRQRFDEEMQGLILESRWWELPLESLQALFPIFTQSISRESIHELIRRRRT